MVAFGGAPVEVLYDNMRTVVIERTSLRRAPLPCRVPRLRSARGLPAAPVSTRFCLFHQLPPCQCLSLGMCLLRSLRQYADAANGPGGRRTRLYFSRVTSSSSRAL